MIMFQLQQQHTLIIGHPFSMYAKYVALKYLARTCAYQGVRNVTYLENIAYVLTGCFLMSKQFFSEAQNFDEIDV